MPIFLKYKEKVFGVGDQIKVIQTLKEGDKERIQAFEGSIISLGGSSENRSFTVRKIGEMSIGIEKIYFIDSPSITDIVLVREGHKGVKQANIKYIRNKSKREIEKIYSRNVRKSKKVNK